MRFNLEEAILAESSPEFDQCLQKFIGLMVALQFLYFTYLAFGIC